MPVRQGQENVQLTSRDIAIKAATAPSSMASLASDAIFFSVRAQLAFNLALSSCEMRIKCISTFNGGEDMNSRQAGTLARANTTDTALYSTSLYEAQMVIMMHY